MEIGKNYCKYLDKDGQEKERISVSINEFDSNPGSRFDWILFWCMIVILLTSSSLLASIYLIYQQV